MKTFKKFSTILALVLVVGSCVWPVYNANALVLPGPSTISNGTATQVNGNSNLNSNSPALINANGSANGTGTLQPGQSTLTTANTPLCSNLKSSNVNEVVSLITCTITGFIVPAIITLAIVSFIWGVVQTLLNPTDEEARKKGKTFIMWGIVALVVITSMWGIVKIFTSTFGLDTYLPPLSQ
jgi:hypothetical protein